MEYTKGEWKIEASSLDSDWAYVAIPFSGEEGSYRIIAYSPNKNDAHLIAAAPDLYEALREIRGLLNMYAGDLPKVPRDAMKARCEQAIAKAEGKE